MALLPAAAYRDVFEPLCGRRIGYVRMPGNVGDVLLELAAFQLLRTYGVDYRILGDSGPGDADEIVVAAGGNMGTFYQRALAIRLRVLAWGRPVTILPQSFIGPEPLPYKRVFVRERESLALRPDAVLAPDLALGLQVDPVDPPGQEEGLWLRLDAEAMFRGFPSLGDPARECRTPGEYLRLASRFRHVITDRLHFAIAALLQGRRVTLLPNTYYKNRAMYECWLRDLGCEWRDSPASPADTPVGPTARTEPQLSLIIVCMGRLDHLRQTLPAAVEQAGCQAVIVDYSCPDRCGDWVQTNYPQARVVRVTGETEFNLARGRNVGARAAETPWLCFVDADVVLAPRFASTVLPLLRAGGYYRPQPMSNGTAGTVVVSRSDFDRVGGYDECYRGYGGEDLDFYDALRWAHVESRLFPGQVVEHLPHSDDVRTRHYDIKNLWESVAVGRAYHRIKLDLIDRTGSLPSPEEREQVSRLVRQIVRTWWAGGRVGPVEVTLQVATPGPGGLRQVTYRFERESLDREPTKSCREETEPGASREGE